jgi:hypothetical protein
VQVPGCDGRVLVAGDSLEQVQLDSGIGHPSQRGVPQTLADKAREPTRR